MVMLRTALMAALGCITVSSVAGGASSMRVWTRAPGNYWDGAVVDSLNPTKISISEKSVATVKMLDIHYDEVHQYRGLSLSELLKSYKPDKAGGNVDTVLLHFSNRMVIPVSQELWQNQHSDYRLLLAVAIKGADGKWTSDFPDVARADERYRDPTPLRFVGNKIVVGKLWRTGRYLAHHKTFQPWKYAGSLVGVEFVNGDAYEAQFARAGGKSSVPGQKVFLDRCQYCHGVRQVGASYGWDFVDPLPIYQKRNVASLFLHVKYDNPNAIQAGLFMPHQKDFTKGEAEPLWDWLKQVAVGKLNDYRP